MPPCVQRVQCVVCQVNGKVIFVVQLPMHHSEISTLTEQEALSLTQQHRDFEAIIGNKPILRHRLIVDQESLSVDLHLTVELEKKKKTDKRSRVDSGVLS